MQAVKAQPMTKCGYCSFGNSHDRCPGGVRNGNGSIHECACRQTERCGQQRCTECNNREPGTIGEDWRCLNRDDCLATQERIAQANPVVMRIRQIREAHGKAPISSDGRLALEGAPRSRETPRKAGGPCLCSCGETTGGGRFRPGHDSKYLNALVASPGNSSRDLAYAVSEAFGKKYEKRAA